MLSPGQSRTVSVTNGWSGRIWGRATDDCGSGAVESSARGAAPPATLAGLMQTSGGADDFYNVSLVDGYKLRANGLPRRPERAVPAGAPSRRGRHERWHAWT